MTDLATRCEQPRNVPPEEAPEPDDPDHHHLDFILKLNKKKYSHENGVLGIIT
jgi:hypothetical protein